MDWARGLAPWGWDLEKGVGGSGLVVTLGDPTGLEAGVCGLQAQRPWVGPPSGGGVSRGGAPPSGRVPEYGREAQRPEGARGGEFEWMKD